MEPDLSLSVSVTTRTPRPSERDGIDYHFIDAARFHALREANDLLEWAEVFGNFYGTPRQPVDAALAAGQDVLFDVDWQGTQQLRAAARSDLVSVFILPPSGEALEQRLNTRAQDSAEVIDRNPGHPLSLRCIYHAVRPNSAFLLPQFQTQSEGDVP